MRGNAYVRFGGRRREDHRAQARHRRLAADPTSRPSAAPVATSSAGRTATCACRWTAAGMLEAEQQFRKIIGYTELAALAVAVEKDVAAKRAAALTSQPLNAPPTAAPEVATTAA